ncbi:hypothetical protein Pcinc_038228 [Petrolisthes cinctipes]|uniref:Nose resistant-to-fluoxetine protein N-terminal domain-containing protein n=1 Tax=Petrolisthes cinctipes TaxID=88211 RepID=A0AAE1BR45_PETCI|nr:hypothetical protein Pcinc_038228 [Petrolisthes cinctipes]
MEVWRVVVVVATLVTVTTAETETLKGTTLWTDSEAFKLEMENWFNGSPEWMLKNLPLEMLDGGGDDDSRSISSLEWRDVQGAYLPSTDPDIVYNQQCRQDVNTFLSIMENPELLNVSNEDVFWLLFMPDSWGKLPDGILYGNIRPWGVMEECTIIDVNISLPFGNNLSFESRFQGRYCLVTYKRQGEEQFQIPNTDHLTRMGLGVGVLPYVSYGTCMPSTCTAEDLQVSIEALRGNESDLHVDCYLKDEEKPLYSWDIVFIVFLAIMGTLLFLASVVDIAINHFNKQHFRKGPLKFVLVFSAYNNLKKIFHHNTKEGPEVISCLHGIRVMSMCWIVWAHSYAFMPSITSHLMHIPQLTDDLLEQTITGAVFGVDTFFFLSGLLVTYGLLKQFTKTKRINWIMYYVHRLIRLTPPILVTAAFMATLSRYTQVGPLSKNVERTNIQMCRNYWWSDVLYISNFMGFDKSCLAQCWYTAVDTQLYVVAPLVFLPLLYRPKIGLPWMGVVTLLSVMIPMIITGVNSLPTGAIAFAPEADINIETYTTPWYRASAYLVGMWGGVILHHFRDRELKLKVWQAVLGWVLATTVGMLVVYGMVDYNTIADPEPIPQGVSIAFDGFGRGSWALAVLWVVFACHKGYGGVINSFLAHPCWQPLSRLTYCIYLTSIPIQTLYPGTQYILIYMNHINEMRSKLGDIRTRPRPTQTSTPLRLPLHSTPLHSTPLHSDFHSTPLH